MRGTTEPSSFDAHRNEVLLIEQRLLPHEFKVVPMRNYEETATAITDMIVRGAGAIGATAAFGFAQGLRAFEGNDLKRFDAHVERVFDKLATARPTAVDPVNAMLAIREKTAAGSTVAERQAIALQGAEDFAAEDVAHCEAIGRHGEPLIRSGMRVLTHCNAGWLAFVDVGSATAPLYAAQLKGTSFHVFCDETRPRAQGASLTAWELAQQGVSHEVIADNAAGHLMQRGEIDLVIVGVIARSVGPEKWRTRSAPTPRRFWPTVTRFPSTSPFPNLRSTGICHLATEFRSRSVTKTKSLGAWGINAQGKRSYVRIANPSSGARNPAFDVTPRN